MCYYWHTHTHIHHLPNIAYWYCCLDGRCRCVTLSPHKHTHTYLSQPSLSPTNTIEHACVRSSKYIYVYDLSAYGGVRVCTPFTVPCHHQQRNGTIIYHHHCETALWGGSPLIYLLAPRDATLFPWIGVDLHVCALWLCCWVWFVCWWNTIYQGVESLKESKWSEG